MTAFSEFLRELTPLSVSVRMILALVCGGFVGIERSYKRRPAGLRTHMLICLGACITILTSQYLLLYSGMNMDVTRMGAQVVAGIGFIGAGTIIVTKNKRIRGLTTAAGLWVNAIIGLCLGSGYWEAGLCATGAVLLIELFFPRLERSTLRRNIEVNLYIRYSNPNVLHQISDLLRSSDSRILHLEITRPDANDRHKACAILLVRLNQGLTEEQMLSQIEALPDVASISVLSD